MTERNWERQVCDFKVKSGCVVEKLTHCTTCNNQSLIIHIQAVASNKIIAFHLKSNL